MDTLNIRMEESRLPECWSDDKRMNALFAPCKHSSLAPEAWRQKVTFWSEQLRGWCRARRSAAVTVSAARDAFVRPPNRPACLHVILDKLVRDGEYVPASQYLDALRSAEEGWVRWGTRLAFKPAAIAVSTLTSLLPFDRVPRDGMAVATIDQNQLFVNTVVIKELADEFLRSLPPDCERVGSYEELRAAAARQGFSSDNFAIMLGFMITQGLAIRKGALYKLAETDQTKAQPINESDETFHKLTSAEKRLENDAEKMRREEEKALEDARRAVKNGNKTQAKSHLIRKHRCSARAESSEAALDNVRRLMLELKQAQLNSGIVDTYRQSLGAMKQAMKKDRLDEDSVHETMDEIRDVLEQYGEVERRLAGGLDDSDQTELEQELDELLNSPPAKTPTEEACVSPPSPPGGQFVYDGEARVLAELDRLDIGESPRRTPADNADKSKPSQKKQPMKLTDWPIEEKRPEAWSPRPRPLADTPPSPRPAPFDALSRSAVEVTTDQRLHPGQRLRHSNGGNIMYGADFQVQDHKLDDGVWLYSARDRDGAEGRERTVSEDFSSSTEHAESPGAARDFAVAPGTERRNDLDDIERRLKDLRSFN